MADEVPPLASRLVGHADHDQPTPLHVGCSIQSADDCEMVVDCLVTISERSPNAVVTCDVPGTVEIQFGEAIRFALTELLSNAVNHAEQETPHVGVSVPTTDSGIRIRIVDDGPGIPADERQAFENATETATDHAIGIGLWLIRWAVDSAGGELDYEEVEPHGSRITIRLPAVAESAVETT